MDSSDIRVIINGQEFAIAGGMLRPVQSSFQSEVLRRLDGIESRLDGIESRLGTVEQEQRLLHSKIDGLQTSVYWILGAIGIFLAAIGIIGIISTVITAFRKPETAQSESASAIASLTEAFMKALTLGQSEKKP